MSRVSCTKLLQVKLAALERRDAVVPSTGAPLRRSTLLSGQYRQEARSVVEWAYSVHLRG